MKGDDIKMMILKVKIPRLTLTLVVAGSLFFVLTGCKEKNTEANTNNNFSIESKITTDSNTRNQNGVSKSNVEKKVNSITSKEELKYNPIEKPKYNKISASEAKKVIDSEKQIVLLDVRTVEEYTEKRIPGSILIPYDVIEDEAPSKLTDKNKKILIYCRSGRRSAIAAESLIKIGYKNVFDFGGINDWPYETETGKLK